MQDKETILSDIVLKKANRAVIAITGKSRIERMLIHLGDPKGHNTTTTMERLDEFRVTVLPDPSHSLAISFCDLFSFDPSKNAT
jgi:hypothetical protein